MLEQELSVAGVGRARPLWKRIANPSDGYRVELIDEPSSGFHGSFPIPEGAPTTSLELNVRGNQALALSLPDRESLLAALAEGLSAAARAQPIAKVAHIVSHGSLT